MHDRRLPSRAAQDTRQALRGAVTDRRAGGRPPPRWRPVRWTAVPGLAVTAAGVAGALVVHHLLPAVSPLMGGLILGAAITNLGLNHPLLHPGLRVAARRLLRAGIVLLGLQLVVAQMLALGAPVLLLTLIVTAVTFLATNWLGRRMGLSTGRSLLVASGFSICGASAIAAVAATTDSDDDDVMTAVALVTLAGSLAIVALPPLIDMAGLDAAGFGVWAGASGPEVAQVVAIAGAVGPAALAPAVLVKLTRVTLLAPLLLALGLWQRRGAVRMPSAKPPPLIPLFVVGFLAAMGLRSLGVVPAGLLGPARTLQTMLLTAAMFGLGSSVRLASLLRTGRHSLSLGLAAMLLVTTVAYVGLRVIG
ncbi:MAG TPA: putative sulfate exporter family transporter [Micromonospora sp.]|nr:putative sulfate exporter family transporter [Micromonospora sp.]